MGLPEFLRARLDEREAVAAAAGGRRTTGYLWSETWPERHPGLIGDAHGDVVAWGEREFGKAVILTEHATHIALNDPAYVLVDVAAKRRIVDEFGDAGEWLPPNPDDDEPEYAYGHARALYDVIKLLAALHDGHPDFDPAWKVD